VGLGSMAGSVGGMIFAATAGYLLEWTGSYMTLFVVSGSAYLVALGVIQMLVPKINTVGIRIVQLPDSWYDRVFHCR